jgi:hypothetical protein
MDQEQLPAPDREVRDDQGTAGREALGQDAREEEVVVRVEHVGQPGGVETDPAGQAFGRGVGDEVELRSVPAIGSLGGLGLVSGPRLAQHEAQAAAD